MQEFKGSPKPWIYHIDLISGTEIHHIKEATSEGDSLAVLFADFPPQEEVKANANLIVTAPELLEALQKTCYILGKMDYKLLKEYYPDMAIQYGENLKTINKALGKE